MFDLIPLPYKILGVIAAFALTFGSGYWKGYSDEHNRFEDYKTEQKIAALEAQARFDKELSERTDQLMTDYNARLADLAAKGTRYVTQAQTSVPRQHDMSNGWISLHDASASSTEIDSSAAADATPSGIGDNQALAVVVSNYQRCNQNSEQLRALQTFIDEYNRAVEAAEKKETKKKKWWE